MKQRLQAILFPAFPAERLAVLRVAVGMYALYAILIRINGLDQLARSSEIYFAPVGLASFLDSPMDPELHRLLLHVTVALGALFVLGVRFAVTGPLFALTFLFVLCYRNSWTMIFHSANLLVFHVAILGLSPAATAWSVDAWIRRRFPTRWSGWGAWPTLPKSPHWFFGWPVQLMSLVTTLTYFLAGLAKVAGPLGIGWASADTLKRQIAVDALRKDLLSDGARDLAFDLYSQTEVLFLLAAGSLVLELAAPLFLATPRSSRVWALAAFSFHWGVFLIMGIKFEYQRWGMAYLSFFPLEKLVRLVAGRFSRPRSSPSRLATPDTGSAR